MSGSPEAGVEHSPRGGQAQASGGPTRVLLVDDDPGDALRIAQMLREARPAAFVVQRVERLEQALERLAAGGIDVVLLDLDLPDSTGLESLSRVRHAAAGLPIVVVSDRDDEAVALEALRSGAQDYLPKARLEAHLLVRVLRHALERARTQTQLRWLTQAVDQSPASVFMTDLEGRIQYANARFTELNGWRLDEVHGQSVRILDPGRTPPQVLAELRESLAGDRTWHGELLGRAKSGTLRWHNVWVGPLRDEAGRVTHYLATQEDVTQRRSLEEQLRSAQKMEAVGRLAGGIAHDFNNLLTAIHGYAELLLEDLPPGSPARHDAEEIRKASQRATRLTRQLLVFSKPRRVEPVLLRLDRLIEDFEPMLRRLLREDIELSVRARGAPATVLADHGQIEQLVMNLVVNAGDAMPGGGALRIETSAPEPGGPGPGAAATTARFVLLEVSDTGSGMDEETRRRAFEPFFTTKEEGQGTGLGLSTVAGIVRGLGGQVQIQSELGQGTTFRVLLPWAGAAAPVEEAEQPASQPLPRGTETVLIAEDEPALRRLARRTLESLGYRVLEAGDRDGALAAARAHTGPIDLLVTDVVMPGGSGPELAQALALARRGVRTLFVSGYPDRALPLQDELAPGSAFLQKPFSAAALAERVRALLDGPGG